MKGWWEFNINVWFRLCISRNESARPRYFQNRTIMFYLPISSFMYLWAIYICSGLVCLFCGRRKGRPIPYINRSQTHECRNWERGRTVSFLGIHKLDYPYSAVGCTEVKYDLATLDITFIRSSSPAPPPPKVTLSENYKNLVSVAAELHPPVCSWCSQAPGRPPTPPPAGSQTRASARVVHAQPPSCPALKCFTNGQYFMFIFSVILKQTVSGIHGLLDPNKQ